MLYAGVDSANNTIQPRGPYSILVRVVLPPPKLPLPKLTEEEIKHMTHLQNAKKTELPDADNVYLSDVLAGSFGSRQQEFDATSCDK
jgi:hypothetical protein